MSITSPTFVPGAVLDAEDLDAAYLILVTEINRLGALPHNANLFGRNLLNNGDFSIWQRGTSQTSSGYGADDRWSNVSTGSTKVSDRQAFAVGQSVVTDNPTYYARTVVTSVAGAANQVVKIQKIEGVQKTSGETVTLTFWAKADSAKNMAVEYIQNFGTGGSPSSTVTAIGVTTVALTTSWVKQTVTIVLPTVSGKTLGTDLNDYLQLTMWFDAGSNHDARSNSLGQQSGTFDIANVQIELGVTATDFEYVLPADQIARCHRYFERLDLASSSVIGTAHCLSTTSSIAHLGYSLKRAIPTLSQSGVFNTLTAVGGAAPSPVLTFVIPNTTSVRLSMAVSSGLVAGNASAIITGSAATIDIDAEL